NTSTNQFNTWPDGDGLIATFTPAEGYILETATLQRPGESPADITDYVLRADSKESGTFWIGAGDNLVNGTYTFTATFVQGVRVTTAEELKNALSNSAYVVL